MKEQKHRKYFQLVLAPLVPLVVIGGYFWPYLGYIGVVMLLFMLTLALFRGRYYCGWYCAMGSFHERILSLISCKKKMLPVFKAQWFRWIVFILMMGLLATRLILSGGDPRKIGATFVMMWSIATGLAIGIGLVWKPRSWCSICPMGMFQGLIGLRAYRLQVGEGCRECGLCEKVCPIETNPGSMRELGIIKSADCLRCGNCVVNCPAKVLSFTARPASTSEEPLSDKEKGDC
ncbi:4Fe-4S binding protein [Thiovibrio frasassiensis]|uniref:4Fe-4S binding protein n=1 Tax=Thiovibrio frasassiensis TaxID=2984131 RepID=A0A9X4RMF6_9BACT|nr:4Fe-4S binding protein [Thiovibrio frasassiensis]MDG4476315.1 4Fe-4S binding protein [Thiovibrio frasassiensis]